MRRHFTQLRTHPVQRYWYLVPGVYFQFKFFFDECDERSVWVRGDQKLALTAEQAYVGVDKCFLIYPHFQLNVCIVWL